MQEPGKLRIALMLESDGPGGAENVVLHLARGLRQRGHSVTPIGPAHGVGWLGERFREDGFETRTYTERPPPDYGLPLRLARELRDVRVDVIHSHEFTMAFYGSFAARLSHAPHVITLHGNVGLTDPLRRRVALRWALRSSTFAVTVSGATKASFVGAMGKTAEQLSVIYNGIPSPSGNASETRAQLGLDPSEVLILAVGNLEPHKGHHTLVRALAGIELTPESPPWSLVIAGGRGGPEKQRLEDLISSSPNLRGRVHILVGQPDVPGLLSAAQVFAMPSLEEGLPLALLEAMFCELPAVASAVGGIPEAAENGISAILVAPDDVQELSRAISKLIQDPGERRRLGQEAGRTARARFTLDGMVSAYEKLYFDAVDSRRRSKIG